MYESNLASRVTRFHINRALDKQWHVLNVQIIISGHYWIDPNEGAPDDAVLVFCDFDNEASCIYPKTAKVL